MNLHFFGKILNRLHLKKIGLIGLRLIKAKSTLLPDYEDSIRVLESAHPDNGKSSLTNNIIAREKDYQYDIQVIMPVYNVETTLREAIESVITPHWECKVLLTIVNDGSTDGSVAILEQYQNIKNIEIINQENQGLSGARNTALKQIKAPYIMLLDSDDCLTSDSLNILFKVASQTNASIIQGSYVTINPNGTLRRKVIVPDKKQDGRIIGFPWGKLYKAEIFDNLHFPEGYWFEDTLLSAIIIPLTLPEKKVSISDIIYKYRVNPQGITATAKTKPKVVDSLWVSRRLYNDREAMGKPLSEKEYSQFLSQCLTTFSRIYSYNGGTLAPYALRCLQEFKKKWFPHATTPNSDYKYIEKALEEGNINQLLFLSGLIR